MNSVQHLLAEYIAEHRSGGEADPRSYLSRASPAQRVDLTALIDAYLARVPRQPFDADAYRGSTAERTVTELERALGGQSGLWPALLPELRDRAALKRTELVQRLAKALGVADKTSKVGDYYHQMEQGTLPSAGVSSRVLEALGQLVGESAEALREAGRTRGEGPGPAGAQAAFARQTYAEAPSAPPPGMALPGKEPAEWDKVDQLFRGG